MPNTFEIIPMLIYCWASVVDGGPTLNQHWLGQCQFNAGSA